MKAPTTALTPLQLALIAGTAPTTFAEWYIRSSLEITRAGFWMPVVLTFAVGLVLAWLGGAVLHHEAGESAPTFIRRRAGPLATLVAVGPITIGYLFAAVVLIRVVDQDVSHLLLPTTPYTLVLISTVIAVAALAETGPTGIARFSEVMVFLIDGPLLVYLLVMAFKNVDPVFWRPLWTAPATLWRPRHLVVMMTAFSSGPLLLVLVPRLKQPHRSARTLIGVYAALAVLFIALTAACLGTFGPVAALDVRDPVIAVLNTSTSSLLIFQQVGLLMLILFTPLVFVAAAGNAWAAATAGAELLGIADPPAWSGGATALAVGCLVYASEPWRLLGLIQAWAVGAGLAYLWVLAWLWPLSLRRPNRHG